MPSQLRQPVTRAEVPVRLAGQTFNQAAQTRSQGVCVGGKPWTCNPHWSCSCVLPSFTRSHPVTKQLLELGQGNAQHAHWCTPTDRAVGIARPHITQALSLLPPHTVHDSGRTQAPKTQAASYPHRVVDAAACFPCESNAGGYLASWSVDAGPQNLVPGKRGSSARAA